MPRPVVSNILGMWAKAREKLLAGHIIDNTYIFFTYVSLMMILCLQYYQCWGHKTYLLTYSMEQSP